MKLTPGVNLANIFMSTFFVKKFEAFLYFQFGFVIFYKKYIGTKVAHKMLVKFITDERSRVLVQPQRPSAFDLLPRGRSR